MVWNERLKYGLGVWTVGLGVACHLGGFGDQFLHVVGPLIALTITVEGFRVIVMNRTLGAALARIAVVAVSLGLIPAIVAGMLVELLPGHEILLTLVVLALLLVIPLVHVVQGRSRAPRTWVPGQPRQSVRSGGGKAVPVPRRWRQ